MMNSARNILLGRTRRFVEARCNQAADEAGTRYCANSYHQ